jgi:cell shape-determining protein MreC
VKKKNGWFLGCCIAFLLFLIFFEPSYGWRLRQWLSPQNGAQADPNSLNAENVVLKAQLAELQTVQSELPNAPQGYLRAMVYSRYPMNFRNEILVNMGAHEGVAAGKAVLFGNIFIGKVTNVFSDSALVQTVFDGDFKMPVRVGSLGYDALLMGGAYPKAGSISKKASLASGDVIITADPNFPYGLPVGVIRDMSISADNLFEEATIDFTYDINSMQTVLIQK